jgi:hypothetical protein
MVEDGKGISYKDWYRSLWVIIFLFQVELISGGEALMKILESTPHGNNLKKSSQINGLGIQKWRNCIEFKMN